MVDSLVTTDPSRLSFSSLAAVSPRRNSIGALVRAGLIAAKPPTGIQLNFLNLLDALREEGPPHVIIGVTDRLDIEERADHLRIVLDAVTAYVKAVVGDTNYNANTNIPDETGLLADATGDIVGALKNKADALTVDEAA